MMNAKRSLVALGAILAVVLSACGGGGGVAPVAYVSDVCAAVGDFQDTIQESRPELNASTLATPTKVKQTLTDYLDTVIAAADEMVTAVDDAGVPNVDNGKRIANGLVDSLRSAVQALKRTRAKIEGLPTNPAAFREGFLDIAPNVQENVTEALSGLKKLDSEQLTKAAARSEACHRM